MDRPARVPVEPRCDAAPSAATGVPVSFAAQGGVAGPRAACVGSAQLFGGALELHIDHHGVVYRLKQTALGKLILTK